MSMAEGAATRRLGGRLGVVALGAACIVLALVVWSRDGTSPRGRNWTAEWHAEPPVVSTVPGGLLEASTMRMAEDFYRSDSKTWWGIYLGETVSHIQAMATYRYGVPLVDPVWEIVTRGPTAAVVAPTLRPSIPVAIDTGTLLEKTESGWARFDKRTQLDDLRRSLSADLEERANDPKRIALAREASRRTIAEFVGHWLEARGEWHPDVFSSVKVFFADEMDDRLRDQLQESN